MFWILFINDIYLVAERCLIKWLKILEVWHGLRKSIHKETTVLKSEYIFRIVDIFDRILAMLHLYLTGKSNNFSISAI